MNSDEVAFERSHMRSVLMSVKLLFINVACYIIMIVADTVVNCNVY